MFVPISTCRVLLFVALVLSQFALASKMTNSSLSLAGTCEAARHFGPVLRGSLLISRGREAWMAEIAGLPVQAQLRDQTIHCVFPGGRGEFDGVLDEKANEIRGHWIQPPTVNSGMNYASPVSLAPHGKDHWEAGSTGYLGIS